jgi:hypothetical protein
MLTGSHLLDGLLSRLWAWSEQNSRAAQTRDIMVLATDFTSRWR